MSMAVILASIHAGTGTSGSKEGKSSTYPQVRLNSGSSRLVGSQSTGTPDPAYNQVYGIATHNSFWINRGRDTGDYRASGTQELLSDQLLHDHVRAIELDVHPEDGPDGRWRVYHTSGDENYSCGWLDECLEFLRNVQYALPQHEVINIIVELKNVHVGGGGLAATVPALSNWNSGHTSELFDDTFRQYLDSALYTPADFLARCSAGVTMRACAAQAGWPTLRDLRGKFIVNLIGNYSSAARDWVDYASTDVGNRVAFPLQSLFQVIKQDSCEDLSSNKIYASPWFPVNDNGARYCIRDIEEEAAPSGGIDDRARVRAFEASVFWQLEDGESAAMELASAFLRNNGVIRTRDLFDYLPGCEGYKQDCQENNIMAGYQFIQTNFPWHVAYDNGPGLIPTDPSQRVKTFDRTSVLREPGHRLYFHTEEDRQAFAYTMVPPVSSRWWETTVSSTRNGDTVGVTQGGIPILDPTDNYIQRCPQPGLTDPRGCTSFPRRAQDHGAGSIRVTSSDGSSWLMVQRIKDGPPGTRQESVGIRISSSLGGAVNETTLMAPRYGPCPHDKDPDSDDVYRQACIGSMIALSVDNQGANTSVVTVYSAGKLNSSGTPEWHALQTTTFNVALTRQGFGGSGDVLLVGPRMREGLNPGPSGTLRDLTLADLPGRELPSGVVASIADLSGIAPTITSPSTAALTVGAPSSFRVTAAGVPAPALTETGELPAGLSFTDNHDGTATLGGTPTAAGSATVEVRASNGVGPDATQTLTIEVAKAPTLTSVTPSPAMPLFGHPVTLTATVSPAPPSSGTPTGTVTFSDGATPLATVALTGGTARFTTAKFQGGLHSISVSYEGDANYLPSQTSQPTALTVGFSQPCITTLRLLPVVVASGEALCIGGGGNVLGPVTVAAGGALSVTGGRITGGIIANGALAVTVCDSTLTGPVSIRASTGYVLVGDDSDDAPGCAGNRINGAVTLSSNTGGLEASGNTVTGSVSVTNNSGSGLLPEDAVPEVEANRILGGLACSGNVPRLVAAGNTVTGIRSGQCA